MTAWRIVLSRGNHQVAEYSIDRGVLSLGRHPNNTVVVNDAKASRHHAILSIDPEGRCHLQDLGSKNGTFVDGRPVTRLRLRSGDSFRVGAHDCRVFEESANGDSPSMASGDQTAPVSHAGWTTDTDLFVGTSEGARELLGRVRKVAATDVNVLITGESGSGKGVVARLLHRWSRRAAKPFISVNCAAIPNDLVESELFGHRKGAFTGAIADHVGKFQAADGGSLFLDEVGDMNLQAQAKILRAIEEQQIEPVGQAAPVPIDVRVVAATNRELEEAIARKDFREDLYFRLATVRLRVPPLRERPDDIVLLANCILSELIDEIPAARDSSFAPETIEALRRHTWPGNVRELRNIVAQAMILKEGPIIRPEDLPLRGQTAADRKDKLPEASQSLAEVEAGHIARALEHHDWNIRRTAVSLGIARNTLRERIERYGLRKE